MASARAAAAVAPGQLRRCPVTPREVICPEDLHDLPAGLHIARALPHHETDTSPGRCLAIHGELPGHERGDNWPPMGIFHCPSTNRGLDLRVWRTCGLRGAVGCRLARSCAVGCGWHCGCAPGLLQVNG